MVFSRIRSAQFSGKGGCSNVVIPKPKPRHNQKDKICRTKFSISLVKRYKKWVEHREKQVNNPQNMKRKNKEGGKDKGVVTLRLKCRPQD